MTSQQLNVDTIAHNLANVNTYGYKKEKLEFKSLLYETIKTADKDPNSQIGMPVNLQVGHGVRPMATSRYFTRGSFEITENPLDLAIDGDGFFVIQRSEGEITYTKDGSFKLSNTEDGGRMIVTSDGYPVLSTDGEPVVIPPEVVIDELSIGENGMMSFMNADGELEELDQVIGLVQFTNVQGLEAIGSNLYQVTPASGEAIYEFDGELPEPSKLVQGVVEMSNVQVAEEMVKMIVAQRAYELNSKAIQTSDDMLQLANNLKR
jgi:flagellar basal-body rod protein FlgG